MPTTTLGFALTLLVSLGPTRHESATAAGMTLDVDVFELDNGLRVNVVEDPSTPIISVVVIYDVGSRDEEPRRSGFAHLFEHMMFKGSKNVPEGGQFIYVEQTGGYVTAFTLPDTTTYISEMPSNYLGMALWLEADRMRSLEITQDNFENQRAAVKEERAMKFENVPYTTAYIEFFAEAWSGTGYGHNIIGSQADLDAAQVQDVQKFFDRHYAPNNAVLAVAGDVNTATVKERVEHYFSDIPRGPDKKPFPKIDHKQSKLERVVEDQHARQGGTILAWKTVPKSHPDRRALDLLAYVLWGGESSRLVKKLVTTGKALQADFGSDLVSGRDAGLMITGFLPIGGTTFDVVYNVVKEEIARIKSRGVSATELKRAINVTTVDAITGLSENVNRAYQVAIGTLEDGDPTRVLTDLEGYRKVTRKDIQRVAKTYLTDDWLSLQIVPPKN